MFRCGQCDAPARLLDGARLDAWWVVAYFVGGCAHLGTGAAWVEYHPTHPGVCELDTIKPPCPTVTQLGEPCRGYPGESGYCHVHAGRVDR